MILAGSLAWLAHGILVRGLWRLIERAGPLAMVAAAVVAAVYLGSRRFRG